MYNLINKQTGIIEFTGSYSACTSKRSELIRDEGGVLSNPNDYYLIEKTN